MLISRSATPLSRSEKRVLNCSVWWQRAATRCRPLFHHSRFLSCHTRLCRPGAVGIFVTSWRLSTSSCKLAQEICRRPGVLTGVPTSCGRSLRSKNWDITLFWATAYFLSVCFWLDVRCKLTPQKSLEGIALQKLKSKRHPLADYIEVGMLT